MIRTVLYGILIAAIAYALVLFKRVQTQNYSSSPVKRARQKFRGKIDREPWIQVYETASSQDAHLIQARLQEEEVECLIYEQGRKDIHGNALKGIGIAVPKSGAALAQKVISRMPV